jgi:hypothetical protein
LTLNCLSQFWGQVHIALNAGGTLPPQRVAFTFRQSQEPSRHAGLDTQIDVLKVGELLVSSAFTRCGDSLFLVTHERGSPLYRKLIQFKAPFESAARTMSLNGADQMNGLEAAGDYVFIASLSRWIDNGAPPSWNSAA